MAGKTTRRVMQVLVGLVAAVGIVALCYLWFVTPTVSKVVSCVESADDMTSVRRCKESGGNRLSVSPALSDQDLWEIVRTNTHEIVWLTATREVPAEGSITAIPVFRSLWDRVVSSDPNGVTSVIAFGNPQDEVVGYYIISVE
jgi:hypothetical protein